MKYRKTIDGKPTKEYRAWSEMISRCHTLSNNRYLYYGARGIQVTEEWRNSFEAFMDYMGPKPSIYHSLERINNDKGYEPGNVKWGTRKEQMRNTRHSIRIEYLGEVKSLPEWVEDLGLDYKRTYLRLKTLGHDPKKAFRPDNLTEARSLCDMVIEAVDKPMTPLQVELKLKGKASKRVVHKSLKTGVEKGLLLKLGRGVYAPIDT